MKLKLLVLGITIFSLLNIPVFGQNQSDNLLILIKQAPNADFLKKILRQRIDNFDLKEAKQYQKILDEGLEHYQSLQKDTAIAHLIWGKAHGFLHESNYPKALTTLNQALELYQKLDFSERIAICYYSLAWLHHKQENFKDFLKYAQLSYDYYQKIPLDEKVCTGVMTLGIAYYYQEQYDQTLHYFQEYYQLATQLQNYHHIAQALGKIGNVYAELPLETATDSVRKYYTLQWEAAQKDTTGNALLTAQINLGSFAYNEQQYEQAIRHFQLAYPEAQKNKRYYEMQWILESMAESQALAGKFEQAYQTFQQYTTLKDSIFSEQKNLQVSELEKKYETEKKDKKIALLAKEKEIQKKDADRQAILKKGFMLGLVLLTILTSLIIYAYHQSLNSQRIIAVKNEEIRDANFQKQKSELEMKVLRAQINPHFFFNCMNSINKMILNQESEEASLYLTKFSKLVRTCLENSEVNQIPLEEELQLLKSYITLEELRFKEKIQLSIHIDSAIAPCEVLIPPLILQPFIENAIWHGFMHFPQKSTAIININILRKNNHLNINIIDNGIGIEKAQQINQESNLKSKSMGIKMTMERLKLLSQDPSKKLIELIDLKDKTSSTTGTRVEICIPNTFS